MSTAVYPLGMRSMPSSGYNHRSTYFNKQYITWKGTGVNSNPVGTAPGHIRPLTNNDPGNVFQTGFGLPRPIKHFRKGRFVPPQPIENVPNLDGVNPHNSDIQISIDENALINYNINRYVKSSKGTSLGGGFGGSGLLNDMQDKPGAFTVKLNTPYEVDGVSQLNADCKKCEGVGIVSSFYPNKTFLQENPEENTTNYQKYGWCCNDEIKAKRRAIYASTNLKKNYYTTTKQYLQNRCKTYDQKAFNFLSYRTNLTDADYDANPYFISVNRDEKIDLLKRNHIQKCIQWCEKNNISHNKFIDSVNIFFKVKKDIDNDEYTDNYNKFNAVTEYDNSVPYEDTGNV